MGLGVFPAVSLKDARTEADKNRLIVSQGSDPLEQQAQQRSEAQRSRRDTFKAEAARYVKAHSPAWSARHAQQWRNSLESYIFPRLGKLPVSDITTDDVVDTLLPIWHSKPVTAERLRNRIELILDASRARELRSGENPARWRGHLDKLLPRRKPTITLMKAMPYATIPTFVRSIDAVDGSAARALELIILTALRTNEVLHARWEEIDLEARIWTIPGDRMKNRKTFRLPVTEAMIAVLEQQKGMSETYVFPSSRSSSHPIALNSAGRLMRSMGVADYVVHGFRSAFRTWAGEETHFPREVCELCLAHTLAGRTEAAYSRGDQLEKRRLLMSEWAGYVRARLAEAA